MSCLLLSSGLLLVMLGLMLFTAHTSVQLLRREQGQLWAVLVAGSRGWENYRHQADVCHAYQVLHRHGVPEDNIIVMMYDDIAHHQRNPYQGQIFNTPNGLGSDVYQGVPKGNFTFHIQHDNPLPSSFKDYTGDNVNPETFLKILQGEGDNLKGKGSGKVLEGGPNDDIFVYFADHGGHQTVNFPNDYLSASTLTRTLKSMHKKNLYRNLLFYLEACNSGSMFEDFLPPDLGILAVTASSPEEASYSCFYNETLDTFMADVFSALWLESAERSSHKTESILEQILTITNRSSDYSHTSVYGDLRLANRSIGAFQGDVDTNTNNTVIPLIEFRDAVPSNILPT